MTVRKLPESKQYIPYPSAATHTMAIQTLAGVGKVFQRFLTPNALPRTATRFTVGCSSSWL